jgi:hypothetical protein
MRSPEKEALKSFEKNNYEKSTPSSLFVEVMEL